MKALVQKELRLLAPAYVMALLLALVPVWLLPKDPYNTPAALSVFPFWFGAVMLALSTFGREFTLRTFPLILAQPLERREIWRTKVTVLAGAIMSVFAVWCLSCAICVHLELARSVWLETTTIGGTVVLVTFAGGLWTTLLLRQVAAAFWFTIFVPGALIVGIGTLDGSGWMIFAALGLYSVLGYLWARRLFLNVQEAGWTGGVVSFPGWRKGTITSSRLRRNRRPLAALFWKELQLHQISLAGMAWLFLVHLGVVALRKYGHDSLNPALRAGLDVFAGVWVLVPLLVGSSSVAEERKLGTIQSHLCLPVSRRLQYLFKLLFALAIGAVLSGLLVWTAEGIGSTVAGGSDIGGFELPFDMRSLESIWLLFLGVALLSFYASTLARNIIQALAVASTTIMGVSLAGYLALTISTGGLLVSGTHLWCGSLVFYFALPTLAPLFLLLAYRNFRVGSENIRLWRSNLLSLGGALLFITASTTATYNRAWEFLLPIELTRGPAKLPAPGIAPRPRLQSFPWNSQAALLPDGRLWVDRIWYDPGKPFLGFGKEISGTETGFRLGGRWESLSGNQLEPGSNWVAVAADFYQTVAIRADGTLWVSEKPRSGAWEHDRPVPKTAAPLVRFGEGSNWQNVVRYRFQEESVLLLKRDGTLWRWHYDHPLPKGSAALGIRSFEPSRLGTDSDWVRLLSSEYFVYAWKKDGSAWVMHAPERELQKGQILLEPDIAIARCASFDNFKLRSLVAVSRLNAAVRNNGTLWAWSLVTPQDRRGRRFLQPQPPVQIGTGTNWTAVGGGFYSLSALKADGSLWTWPLAISKEPLTSLTNAPVRLGTHNDWVGLGGVWEGTVALAGDGSLWCWWDRSDPAWRSGGPDQPLLAPSRRPSKIEDILVAQRLASP